MASRSRFWVTAEPGFDMIHRQDSGHEAASKLYTELKDCLFPKHGGSRKPAIPGPTENLEFFEKAISIVASLKDIGEKDICTKVLNTIKKKIKVFDMKDDFPFYISLIGYFSLHWPTDYDLDDVVRTCKESFEKMNFSEIMKILDRKLQQFLVSSASCSVNESDDPPTPAFSTLLFEGCLRFVQDFDMYSSVLWISIAIIVKYKSTEGTMPARDSDDLWKIHLVEKSKEVLFGEGDLRKMKYGIRIVKYVEKLFPGTYTSIYFLSHAFNGSTQYSLKFASELLHIIIDKFGIHDARNASNYIRLDIQQKFESLSEPSSLNINLKFINHVSFEYPTYIDGSFPIAVASIYTDLQRWLSLISSLKKRNTAVGETIVDGGIQVFQLFDDELQKLETSSQKKGSVSPEDLEVEKKVVTHEIDSWIYLLMKILLNDGKGLHRNENNPELIVRVLEESERSVYMKKIATAKIKELVEDVINKGSLPMKLFYPLYHKNKKTWENKLVLGYVERYQFAKLKCDLNDVHWMNFFKDLAEESTDVEFERCVIHFFQGCQLCDKQQKQLFLMKFFKLVVKNSFYVHHLKENEKLIGFISSIMKDVDILDIPLKKVLKYTSKSKGEVGDILVTEVQKELVSACQTSLLCDSRVIKCLGTLSKELTAGSTGRKCSFSWEIINAAYGCFPPYSMKFPVQKYEEVIQSTASVLKSRFKDWYKIDAHYCLDVTEPQWSKLTSKGEHYFIWVTECLKDIGSKRRLLEDESGNSKEMKNILGKSPEMNQLLTTMLPEIEAQKLLFDPERVEKAISYFCKLETSITSHLLRKSSGLWKDLYSLLVNYGIKFPNSLLKDIEGCLVGHISGISTSGYVTFKQEVKLHTLKLLDANIDAFLKPLKENMEFFVFFSLHDSLLFKSHLKAKLQCKGGAVSMKDLSTELKTTREVLSKFVNGNIDYNSLTLHGAICLNTKDVIEKEFAIFEAALLCKHVEKQTNSAGYKNLKVLFELFEIANSVQVLYDIFERFELKMIIEQHEFFECYESASKFKGNQCQIKLDEVMGVLTDIQGKLHLKNSEECRCLEVLPTIKDGRELFNFILSRKFYGEGDTFRSRFQFITTQLQSMDYDENVLNNLPAAVRLLAPFCSIKNSDSVNPFKDFMESLKEYSRFEIEKLKIVNKHMSIVQRWFSTSNDGNLLVQLADIAKSGSFDFGADHKKLSYTLSFISSNTSSEVILQPEEVNDFSRAIRFYEGKEGEENLKRFKYSLEVIHRLLDIMQTANEVGYCLNLSSVSCSMPTNDLSHLVDDASTTLSTFIDKVARYQERHPWLLLISTPKILLLSDILSQPKPSVLSIVCEIIHITSAKWEDIESEIERAVVDRMSWRCGDDPVQQVGKFLQYTSKLYTNKAKILTENKKLKLKTVISKSQLVDIVYEVYGGKASKTLLKPHLLLICGSETSENALEVMFKRAKKFIDVYMIIGVDKLCFKLQEALTRLVKEYYSYANLSVIYLIETQPSCLRDFSWMCEVTAVREYDHTSEDFADYFSVHCRKSLNVVAQLIHSQPGDGKTHYIHRQKDVESLSVFSNIAIDESFSIEQVICDLRKLYGYIEEVRTIGIFFNFTLFKSADKFDLWNALSWFFFQLFVLGYVEDDKNGKSFALLRGVNWKIYIEAPSTSEDAKEKIFDAIPILKYACESIDIDNVDDYEIDGKVQLVCKYLQAHHSKKLNPEAPSQWQTFFSSKPLVLKVGDQIDLPQEKCYEIIALYMPPEKYWSNYSKKLFIQYMYKRCKFLDDSEGVPNRQKLMDIMLSEARAFTSSSNAESWSSNIKNQVIYRTVEEEKAIFLMCTDVENIGSIDKESGDKEKSSAKECSIMVPKDNREVHSFHYLTVCLSRAFGIKRKECVACLQELDYVLTPDFAMKMINICERMECKSPLVISGETGVGKSFLVEVVSKLWNLSSTNIIRELQISLFDKIKEKGVVAEWEDLANKFYVDGSLQKNSLSIVLASLDVPELIQLIKEELDNSLWMLLDLSIQKLQQDITGENNPVEIIYSLLTATKKRDRFFKLPVHSALSADDISNFFKRPIELCRLLLKYPSSSRMPSVIVFIDELNTCSCGGFLKEIIADRTFHGEALPENLFVIAACNPHRGNSVILESDFNEYSWARGTYYVKELHPTLKFMMWDFSALTTAEERNYVHLKVDMIPSSSFSGNPNHLIDVIVRSQQLIREYAEIFIAKHLISPSDAKECAKSCVSQRDIQRVFVFFVWISKVYKKYRHDLKDLEQRAVLVSIGLVYYLRLSDYRNLYATEIDKIIAFQEVKFLQAFDEDVDWFISHLHFPDGVAQTKALKQNLFAAIACTCTKTPLILVGKPGTSKTLSFNIAVDNLKGIDSDRDILKDTELFPALDPQVYQCSRQTTSYEIDKLFRRAIKRQATYSNEINCVVFMDEAGLPEERHESLKVLHHYLDEHEVSFVAISNHILDAAKTNRAISVMIPETTEEDLVELVKGCYKDAIMTSEVVKYCPAFLEVIKNECKNKEWKRVFGMRDFMHFLHYIYQKGQQLTPKLVLHALERNFNGTDDFDDICEVFCQDKLEDDRRDVLEVLKESIDDTCDLSTGYIRYKLIIDPSEDDSMISFLLKYGILRKEKTRRFISSNLFGDKGLAKVDIISAVCHSITKGHTVVMNQTEDIHECFYDLFNLRFRGIKDSNEQCSYFANVAIGGHIKPIRVNPDFQCVIVLKQSKLADTPPPFLNRFEKYKLSHETLFTSILKNYPLGVRRVIDQAIEKIISFTEIIEGSRTLYGYRQQTLYSLLLVLLTSKVKSFDLDIDRSLFQENKHLLFHITLVNALNSCGISITEFYTDVKDMENDASTLFELLLKADTYTKSFERLSLSLPTLLDSIKQAMDILMSSKPCHITACDNFILSYTLQLIIRTMCKALMQVMTPEGVLKFRKSIPCSYLHTYLYHQDHFALKDIIDREVLKTVNNKRHQSVWKYIVYCRSSALFQRLPSVFPSMDVQDKEFLQTNILADLSSLSILNLSVITSQQLFTDKVDQFFENDSMKLLILVINMLESSPEAVNHLRMMIEEYSSEVSKSIVLLLHFPSSMFFNGIYPTLFLHGWNYRYINSLANKAESGLVNVEIWMKKCLDRTISLSKLEVDDTMLPSSLFCSVKSAIPLLIADFKSNKYINETEMNVVLSTEVARLICDRFLEYFDAKSYTRYLEDVANAVYQRKCTINLKIQIEEKVKDNFFYFIKYIMSFFHVHGITAALMNNCSDTLRQFIRVLIPFIPVPDLLKLADEIPHFPQATLEVQCSYKLPFFLYAFEEIEALIVSSKQDIINANKAEHKKSKSIKRECFASAISNLQKMMQECATFGTQILDKMGEDELMQIYIHDFVFKHLAIDIKRNSFIFHLMSSIKDRGISKCREVNRLACDLVAFHFQYQVHRKLINSTSSILRLLNGIDSLLEYDSQRWIVLGVETPIEMLSDSKFEVMCQYVLTTLHSAFCISVHQFDLFNAWDELYSTMISDDKYTSKLYKIFREGSVSPEEAKWNLMHSVHAVYCSSKGHPELPAIILEFYMNLKDEDNCHLKCIHQIYLDIQKKQKFELSANIFYDSLFAHFFSTYRSKYCSEDILCFLAIISGDKNCHVSRSVLAFYFKTVCNETTGLNSQVRGAVGYTIDKNLNRPVHRGGMGNLHKTILKNCPVGRLFFMLRKEELTSRSPQVVALIDKINKYKEQLNASGLEEQEIILLSVEIEAMKQVAVKMVAKSFSSGERSDIQYIFQQQMSHNYIAILKSLLMDEEEEYSTILMKYMLEWNNSLELFHKNYEILCGELGIQNKTKKKTEPVNVFSSFISSFFEHSHIGNAAPFFSTICNIIDRFQKDRRNMEVKLKELHQKSKKMQHILISGESLFLMALWLGVFQELFEKKKTSPILCDCLKDLKFLDPTTEHLFIWLIDPTYINSIVAGLALLLSSMETGVNSTSMRRSMAIVIAGILGSGSPSFLHTQLFKPTELMNTYIPGFMSEKCLSEDVTYYMGTKLTSDGLYDTYSQYDAAKNRGLCPRNIYILSWMNFSSLLFSILSDQVTYEDLSKVVVGGGDVSELSTFLKSQLLALWRSMQRHFGFLHEELEYLTVELMQRLVKVSNNGDEVFGQEGRDAYERMVSNDVIVPALSSLGDKPPYRNGEILKKARLLEGSDYLNLTIADVGYIAASKPSNLLSEYLFTKEALEIVAKFLPTLVELYEFIHREISYRITKDTAKELKIQEMLNQLKKGDRFRKYFSQEDTKNLKEMINKYFDGSKAFIEATGLHEHRKWLLDKSSSVISLMSTDEDNGDCLYRMIISMVEYHNMVIDNLCRLGDTKVCDSSLCCISDTKPLAEPITLVERCSLTVSQRRREKPFSIQCTEGIIDEDQIEHDIIQDYMRMKCRITVHNFRKSLKFVTSVSMEDEFQAKQHGLPASLMTTLSENLDKQIHHNFSSSSLSDLRSIMLGLIKIIGSLHQYCNDFAKSSSVTIKHYIRSFLLEENMSDSISRSTCIDKFIRAELAEEQLSCLEEIKIEMLVSVVRLFCDWIRDGLCEFCEVDLIFKRPLSAVTEEELEKNTNGETIKLLLDLEALITKIQPEIMQKRSEHKMPLVSHLKSLPGDNSKLINLVPKSICLENYVYFRIKIRKLIVLARDQVATKIGENGEKSWSEMVDYPWMGWYKVNDDEPIIVHEDFISENELETSFAQFHGTGGEPEPQQFMTDTEVEASTGDGLKPDTIPEDSIIPETVPDVSEFESDEDEDIPCIDRKPLVEYTEEDLVKYLADNGMTDFKYIIEEDINGEVISGWELWDFEEAGVSNVSDQVKLYLLFSRLKPAPELPTPYVVQFLESIPSFEKYARIFGELEINGDILLKSKASFLRKIGVGSVLDASKIIVLFRQKTGVDYNHVKSQEELIRAIERTDIKEKSEYIKVIQDKRLSFSILKEGGAELLIELGFKPPKARLLTRKLHII